MTHRLTVQLGNYFSHVKYKQALVGVGVVGGYNTLIPAFGTVEQKVEDFNSRQSYIEKPALKIKIKKKLKLQWKLHKEGNLFENNNNGKASSAVAVLLGQKPVPCNTLSKNIPDTAF